MTDTNEGTEQTSEQISEVSASSIYRNDPIFEELRDDYPDFDEWWDKCIQKERICWVIYDKGELAGLVVLKKGINENFDPNSKTDKRLKVSTFKVGSKHRGLKLGELFLRKIAWYAQENGYNSTYLTAFDNQPDLVELIGQYGFFYLGSAKFDQSKYEKSYERSKLKLEGNKPIDQFTRENYPRFLFDEHVNGYILGIQSIFFDRLFPDLSNSPYSNIGEYCRSGNAIKKELICKLNNGNIETGSILVFCRLDESKHFLHEVSVTAIGIFENCRNIISLEQLIDSVSSRSVYSVDEIRSNWNLTDIDTVAICDFILVKNTNPPISLNEMLDDPITEDFSQFNSPFEIENYRVEEILNRSNLNFEI